MAPTTAPGFVLGGGSPSTDCRVGFDGVDATNGASEVVCMDGDPACDGDGTLDGTCTFAVSLCTGIPLAGCSPVPIDDIAVSGLPFVAPSLPTKGSECGPPLTVTVPAGTAAGATVLARGGGGLRDVDYLNLCCAAGSETSLTAARCALAVDLDIAGCTSVKVPERARAAFHRARMLVDMASTHPRQARSLVRQSEHALQVVRRHGRTLAHRDACGFSIGLIASHALTVLGAPAAAGR
jgi:hypothetical protein